MRRLWSDRRGRARWPGSTERNGDDRITDGGAGAALIPTVVTVAVATLVGYLALLGWDQRYDTAPNGIDESGPYSTWQVVCLVAVLVGCAAWGGWHGRVGATAVVVTTVLTISWSVNAVLSAGGDQGLWPIGAISIAVWTGLGTAVVALVARTARGQRDALAE